MTLRTGSKIPVEDVNVWWTIDTKTYELLYRIRLVKNVEPHIYHATGQKTHTFLSGGPLDVLRIQKALSYTQGMNVSIFLVIQGWGNRSAFVYEHYYKVSPV